MAEGSGSGPVVAEDAERIGELGLESQQGGGVGFTTVDDVVAAAGRRSGGAGHDIDATANSTSSRGTFGMGRHAAAAMH